MPIHVITGLPGDGKTATMMELLLAAAEKGDRPIYAAGIDGLQPGLATVLQNGSDWATVRPYEPRRFIIDDRTGDKTEQYETIVNVPNGSLIFVDEAWKWFGHLQNPTRQATPPHVLALAEHRHYGIDFVWTTQGPGQIFPFARTLVGEHWHVCRKFGTKMQEIFKWGELQDDVKSQSVRERGIKEIKLLPTKVFGLYKSAAEHTIKSRIPWKVWLLPATIIAAVLMVWTAYRLLTPDANAGALEPSASLLAPAAPAGGAGTQRRGPVTLESYLVDRSMRAPGLHGSQPVFDGREAKAEPRTFCVMSGGTEGDENCTCYTEQATRLFDVREDVCRHVARWGEYDPYLAPMQAPQALAEQPAAATARPGEPAGAVSDPSAVGSGQQGEVWGKHPETLRPAGS